MVTPPDADYDVIVIGSGFGGVMAAHPAVHAGKRVLMIERGDWVARGPTNWGPAGFCELTDAYSREAPYRIATGGDGNALGTLSCVGGASVFYGGVALRLRESDFEPNSEIDHDSGAEWPYRYSDLERYYARAEAMLGVAGTPGVDPTEPWRSTGFSQPPDPLAPASNRIAGAARSLGLHPFRLPLAINYTAVDGQPRCVACNTCDGFACAIGAKNDLATATIPSLCRRGLTLTTNTVAVNLVLSGRRIVAVECRDRATLEPSKFRARAVVLAAGALATPHLLLASDLAKVNPAGDAVGRYLMRHCNAVVMGAFVRRPAPNGEFHKQLGIQDYYFGHPSVAHPRGKLGCIQQWGTPQVNYVLHYLSGWKRIAARIGVPHTTGLIAIAEDRPHRDNRVALMPESTLPSGLPEATITHAYDARDLAARQVLVGVARRILKRAGAITTIVHDLLTFSHAVGTVRLGPDPTGAPLDERGGYRGLDNLYVTDGSALPKSGGVNPSLTIAANALRTGDHIVDGL